MSATVRSPRGTVGVFAGSLAAFCENLEHMSSMKAIRLIQPGRPLELCHVPIPIVGESDVLVRVQAAGVCHSDAHYRGGISSVSPLPLTLGHEVAGWVEQVGSTVKNCRVGDRVCLHYLATCGSCQYCERGIEQFCSSGAMMGKHRDGGFAEFVVMPARSIFPLPESIPFTQGAILMCSAATSLHAISQSRLKPGETVAVFGVGGLGFSAIQLARAAGAREVYAVDIHPAKLQLATELGAKAVDAAHGDPVQEILRLTQGRGVDVALELIGLPLTMRQALRCLAIKGRAALAGISDRPLELVPYHELLNRETELIGVSDHLASELPSLLATVMKGELNLSQVVTRTIPLEAAAVNETLDKLEQFGEDVRVVVVP